MSYKDTPEKEKAFVEKLNEDFFYFLDAYPLMERGGTIHNTTLKKLRVQLEDDGRYHLGDIYFELMMELHTLRLNGYKNPRLLINEIDITPEINDPNFCPRRGIMIRYRREHDGREIPNKKNSLDRY